MSFPDKGGTTEEWNRLKDKIKFDILKLTNGEKEVLYERKSQFVVISKVFQDGIWNILLKEK